MKGVVVLLAVAADGQVAGQLDRQQAQVGEALDVGVTAQGVHAATRQADVAQQQLNHGAAADDLCPDGVLGPAQGIEDGHDATGRRGLGDFGPDLLDRVGRRATGLAGHFQGVATVVLLHQLEDAARILQGRIDLDEAVVADLVAPVHLVGVGALLGVIAVVQAVLEGEAFLHQEAGVGVVADVLLLNLVVGDQVIDQPPRKAMSLPVRIGA